MSLTVSIARRAFPPAGWLIALGVALAIGVAFSWILAAGLLALLLAQRLMPLDFLMSYLIVLTGASFVDYTRGQLTAQLALLTLVVLFMLACYVLARRGRLLTFRKTPLLLPLGLYIGLSALNSVRGFLVGNSLKYGGLEVLAVAALGSCLLVAAVDLTRRQLQMAAVWLVVVGLAHLWLGLHVFGELGVRTGMLSFTPVPGVVAMLVLNLALRAETPRGALLWSLAFVPLVVHQFVSFTRGYWLAMAVGTVFSLWVFARSGPGVRKRLARSMSVLSVIAVIAVIGAVGLALSFGIQNLGEETANRLASSVSTKIDYEAGSNFVRLSEYLQVSQLIAASPLIGHGFGFFFVVREPFSRKLIEQAFMHQNYLYVWLKQGLVGLAIFVWMLVAAVRTGLRGRALPDAQRSAWSVGAAAATVYVAAYGMVHFPLAEVNTI
jgi:O-antigen ligase